MKSQIAHSTPIMLGPFLRLVLTLRAHDEAETADNLQGSLDETLDSSAALCDRQQAPESSSHISSTAMTLGPFLTLLLTSHHASLWADRYWCPGVIAPQGAILAARYVSR